MSKSSMNAECSKSIGLLINALRSTGPLEGWACCFAGAIIEFCVSGIRDDVFEDLLLGTERDDPQLVDAVEYVRGLLITRLTGVRDAHERGTLINLLARYRDKRHIPLFASLLISERTEFSHVAGNLYSLLNALTDSGEKGVFSPERTCRSFDECNLNARDAANYLRKKFGVNVPG